MPSLLRSGQGSYNVTLSITNDLPSLAFILPKRCLCTFFRWLMSNFFRSLNFPALVINNSESTLMLHSKKSLRQYLALFYSNFEIGWAFFQCGTLTTSSGHSLSSSIYPVHSQSYSSNILPRNPPKLPKKIPFLMLSARLWLGCCGPNLHWARPNLGPGTFSSFLPVQNDLLWFSREIYIPTPVTTCFEFCQNSQKITTSSGHSLYSSISTYNLLLHPSS